MIYEEGPQFSDSNVVLVNTSNAQEMIKLKQHSKHVPSVKTFNFRSGAPDCPQQQQQQRLDTSNIDEENTDEMEPVRIVEVSPRNNAPLKSGHNQPHQITINLKSQSINSALPLSTKNNSQQQ